MSAVAEMPNTPAGWRELRDQRGHSDRELAELTSLDVGTIHRLEAGAHVTRSTRKLVAAALGVPVFATEEAIA